MNPAAILQFIGIPILVASGTMFFSWKFLSRERMQPLGGVIAVGASSVVAFVLQEGMTKGKIVKYIKIILAKIKYIDCK